MTSPTFDESLAKIEATVKRTSAEIDRLKAQKNGLLAAAKLVSLAYEDNESSNAISMLRAAIAKAEKGAS